MNTKMLFQALSFGLMLMILIGCGGRAPSDSTPELQEDGIFFYADQSEVEAGQCTFLRWEVIEGFGASLDGEEIPLAGEKEVCPTESHVFELVVDMGDRAETRIIEIAVSGEGAEPAVEEPEIITPVVPPSQTETVETEPPKAASGQVRIERDLKYATNRINGQEKSLLLDLYLPASEAPSPVLLFIHGGGWFEGSKDDCPGEVLAQYGYATACLNYRLAPSTESCSSDLVFPAQIHDVKAAVRWLRLNAESYGLDSDRFGAVGDSSGGHLAALLGVSSGIESLQGTQNPGASDAVQAVGDWFGPVDVTQSPPDILFTDDPCEAGFMGLSDKYGGEATPYFYWTFAWAALLGGPLDDSNILQQAQAASPLTYVDSQDPPFLIMHGESDGMIPIDQSELLAYALRAAGVEVTFTRLAGIGHGYYPPEGRQYIISEFLEPTLEFFDRYLKNK